MNIAETFYQNGGYTSDSSFSAQDNYIPLSDVSGSYIPQAVMRMNRLCETTVTISSLSSGNVMHDTIIAELALSIADSEYDKVHIDPETGEAENKHYMVARQYMLDMFGVPQKGAMGRIDLVLPAEALYGSEYSGRAYDDLAIATMSD